MSRAGGLAGILGLTVASSAAAQPVVLATDVPGPPFAGVFWSVAAPQGAAWALDCRFVPLTYPASRYDLHYWANRMRHQGTGPERGRLPGPDGRCKLTKTHGEGPVGFGLAFNGKTVSAGTNDPAGPAYATIY